jgi:hypothetical protein
MYEDKRSKGTISLASVHPHTRYVVNSSFANMQDPEIAYQRWCRRYVWILNPAISYG